MRANDLDSTDFVRTGPGTLAGRYLRSFWQPILLSEELLPERPLRVRVMGEWLTAYRGGSGRVYVTEDRCPHRSTLLSLGWVEGDNLRCFYHGWMFGPEGRCVEQPAEGNNTLKDRVQIKAYPVLEYMGMVFAYLGEGEAPEFPLFPEIDTEKDTVFFRRHEVPCNYFQRIENDLDELHIHFVHRVSTEKVGLDEIPELQISETEYGVLRKGVRIDQGKNVTRTGHFLMPNILMVITPGRPSRPEWQLHIAWRVPVDDENMWTFVVTARKGRGGGLQQRPHVEPDPMYYTNEILAGRMRVQDIDPDYPALFNVQDNVALGGQGAIVDRSREQLSRSDKGVVFIRRIWMRELRALVEGKPLKAWRRPSYNVLDYASKEMELAMS
jgi:5,5'-dehydrodivanillate O-demethylase